MGKKIRTVSNLELVGGRLCLNFANTVSTRSEPVRNEYLASYDELVAWSQHVEILTADQGDALLRHAARHADAAATVLDRAIVLREAIYGIFAAVAGQQVPQEADLAELNVALRKALARLEIQPAARGFEWAWILEEGDLDRMLWPVARSAADLLISEELERVRKCAGKGCDWLFLDSSKNHSRRWCMMGVCGSRVKSRRYYQRKKRQAAA
jgi:predicted RNA-binding Zn ribbon-like protein